MSHKLMQIEDSEEIEKVTRNTLHPSRSPRSCSIASILLLSVQTTDYMSLPSSYSDI